MKKILSVVALIAISASLVACGGKKEEPAPAAPAVVEEPAPAAAPATTEATPATTEAAPATTEAAPATTEAAPAAPAAPAK